MPKVKNPQPRIPFLVHIEMVVDAKDIEDATHMARFVINRGSCANTLLASHVHTQRANIIIEDAEKLTL